MASFAGVLGAPGVIGGELGCAQQPLCMARNAAYPTGVTRRDAWRSAGGRRRRGWLRACIGSSGRLCRRRLVTGQALVVLQIRIFVELWNLRNTCPTIAVAAQALRSTRGIMRDGRRPTGGRYVGPCWTPTGRWRCRGRRNCGLVARQANVIPAPDVVGWIGLDFASLRVTELAVWRPPDGMRNLFRRHIRIWIRRDGRREDLGETDRIQSCKAPIGAVAGAVGAERRIIFAAGVVGVVACLAGRVKRGAVLGEPGGVLVGIRLP